jgi:hypothetical protein
VVGARIEKVSAKKAGQLGYDKNGKRGKFEVSAHCNQEKSFIRINLITHWMDPATIFEKQTRCSGVVLRVDGFAFPPCAYRVSAIVHLLIPIFRLPDSCQCRRYFNS